MEKQKKIALINDLTGFGRCSTAVMAPIVSAMKIQAVAVPTAILSAHTQFPTYYFDDYTDRMKDYIQTYKDLKLDFDAISTGFLGSEQQVDIVLDFIRHFKTDRNFVIVDPVMGDYGKLYRTYTVTEDGAETDLDLGHYERFVDENLTRYSSVTSGQVFFSVLKREREGGYHGGTVQVIPHITDEIKEKIHRVGEKADVVITEIGGTVGDIEGQPFIEAIRQFQWEVPPERTLFIHVTLIPYLKTSQELKTKPTQHSVKELQGSYLIRL